MKKYITLLLTISFIFLLMGCGNIDKQENSKEKDFFLELSLNKEEFYYGEKPEITGKLHYGGKAESIEIMSSSKLFLTTLTQTNLKISSTTPRPSFDEGVSRELKKNSFYEEKITLPKSFKTNDKNKEILHFLEENKGEFLPKGDYKVTVLAEFTTGKGSVNDLQEDLFFSIK